MSLADEIKAAKPTPKPSSPVWKGPEEDGITFSLLCRFLSCRERFRITVVEGFKPEPVFNHKIEYGSMWHACEEVIAKYNANIGDADWIGSLVKYTQGLCKTYPLSQQEIFHWHSVCLTQFPLYYEFWRKNEHTVGRTPVLQEKVFNVQYKLPSGRLVRLRGKFDSVDLVADKLWLQENKSKGDIKEDKIRRQLKFDLQTMLYLVALEEYMETSFWQRSNKAWRSKEIAGVRYNVVKRPLSGGEGTIRQHKPSKSNPKGESKAEFYHRLSGIIKEAAPSYFMRWVVPISKEDITKFKNQCLNPILENLCGWWEHVTTGRNSLADLMPMNWRHPFGVYNVLDEGGSTDLDNYLETGSTVGLRRVENLFPELTE